MRPRTASIGLASDYTVANSGASPDWTAGTYKMTLTKSHAHCDDFDHITISSGDVVLPGGIWMFTILGLIDNVTAGDESFEMALTDAAGTTEYYTSPSIEVPASSSYFHRARHVAHLTDSDVNTIALQIAQTTGAGTDLRWKAIPAGGPGVVGPVLIVTKVGNRYET